MSGPELITLGCRLNIVESEAMRMIAADMSGADDLVIVNSCAVTAEAVKQARQAIRRARRERPEARIIVTGCAAQTEPHVFAAMPEVDRVIGNGEKLSADHYRFAAERAPADIRVGDIMAVRETTPHLIPAFASHARGFVEVQNGCDHRCTFCVIPHGRGNSRSVPAGHVIERIEALVDGGVAEVVLTGVDLTSYGADLPGQPSLALLIERILVHVPGLVRLRLSSLDPVEIDDRLLGLVTGEPRIAPHLHLSLQAGDDMILKRMKRRHDRRTAVALVERLKARRPEIAIGADIIAGFPTEDEAMFANTLALIGDCAIVHGHIFPYSPRPFTPAARMPQVDRAVVRARAARLRTSASARKAEWLRSLIGSEQMIVPERCGTRGHAGSFAEIRLGGGATLDAPAPVRIVDATPTHLIGRPI